MKSGVRSRGSPMLKLIGVIPGGHSSRTPRSSRTNGYSTVSPRSQGAIGPGRDCTDFIARLRARPVAGASFRLREELREPAARGLEVRDRAVLARLVAQLRHAGPEVDRRHAGRGELRDVGPPLLARHLRA